MIEVSFSHRPPSRRRGRGLPRARPPDQAHGRPVASRPDAGSTHAERQRRWPRRVRIVPVKAVAEKWLVPRLATFKAEHPAIAIASTKKRTKSRVRRR